ncbi:hypothetical protein ACSDQ9_10730 [Aestuariimicrobium soli]|uniref:hypothetical protein n=1 Tax=Aestuariimicrobium soli TaxID=2035834 RepID=UPI003EBA57BE
MRRWAVWLNAALVALGLAAVVVGLLVVGRGPVTCRGVEMKPGDVCVKSSFTDVTSEQTQSYEQRRASANASRPSVIGAGVAVAAFGGVLLAAELRRRRVT